MGNPNHDKLGRFTFAKGIAAGLGEEQKRRTSHVVSARALRATRDNGGVTIDLKGNQPAEGYAFAPRKDTEEIIPEKKLKMRDIDDYIDRHLDQLSEKGGHLGMWTQDGNVYLDVSHVGPADAATIAKAQAAQ